MASTSSHSELKSPIPNEYNIGRVLTNISPTDRAIAQGWLSHYGITKDINWSFKTM